LNYTFNRNSRTRVSFDLEVVSIWTSPRNRIGTTVYLADLLYGTPLRYISDGPRWFYKYCGEATSGIDARKWRRREVGPEFKVWAIARH
jgi:hypothetical protein